jgi:23S rRNA (uracil1939-C5)-methyltransferase
VWGEELVAVPLPGGGEVRLRAGDFTQVNDAANAELVRVVLDFADVGASDVVADLYAGAGNLTLPLAERAARVLAVDRVKASVDAAADNARRLGLANVETVAGDVGRALKSWVTRGLTVDVVVLDPPRSGAADAVPSSPRLGARRIVYVSCNPATLARDLRALSSEYALAAVQPIDFFPQTYHVETVALLVRRAG